ncbi:MAG: SGNH/GDSL hydrolase family protein [Leifsonia sp.]
MLERRKHTGLRPWSRRTRFVASAAAATAVALSLLTGTAASAAPKGYLALGDSYAAGQAIGGAKGADAACLQSTRSYPSQVAENLGLTLTDNTCSGAVLDDVFSTSAAGRAPQASAPADSISLITLTMGGNDLGFAPILTQCLAVSPTGPLTGGDASCKAKHTANGTDDVLAKLTNEVTPKFAATLAKLRSTYPAARIMVVGYLPLMPDAAHTPAGGCYSKLTFQGTSFPFVTSDLEWMNSIQRAMDAQFDRAAEDAGVEYLSQLTVASGHTACSAAGAPYLAPLTINGLSGATPTSLHPNEAGLAFAGQSATSALSTRAAFQGIRGQLVPQGGDAYELQIVVPKTLGDMPDVYASRNGQYLANVKGGSGYYLIKRVGAQTITYSQPVTVAPGDQVELRVYQNGTRQVLTPLPDSFRGVTGQLVRTGDTTYQLQVWVPLNTLYQTPDVSARVNGAYSGHVSGPYAYYLDLGSAPGYTVYSTTVTLKPGDTVVLNVTSTGEKQTLS